LNTIPSGFRGSSLASFAMRSANDSGRRSSAVELQKVERILRDMRNQTMLFVFGL
jgi:hypothetical protein